MSEPTLALVIIAVEQLARSENFYDHAFGWKHTVDTPAYIELALPNGMRLGLYDRDGFRRNIGQTPAPSPHNVTATELYIYVDDVETASKKALKAGARMLSPAAPRDWGDLVAYFADPDGNVLAIAEPLS